MSKHSDFGKKVISRLKAVKKLYEKDICQADETDIKKKADRIGVPVVPPIDENDKKEERIPEANPTIAVCGKCGIEVKAVMHYSCPKANCPCFIKPTY